MDVLKIGKRVIASDFSAWFWFGSLTEKITKVLLKMFASVVDYMFLKLALDGLIDKAFKKSRSFR